MPKGLFSQLLNLFPDTVPEENYFTELVGWLFEEYPYLPQRWLKESLHLDAVYMDSRVKTQVKFVILEGHQTASRPDIMVFLQDGPNQDVVMIESKLGAPEGGDQLPRYAEQLSINYPEARQRFLIYITRSYDPKNPNDVLRFVKNNHVEFKQLQWYEFYQFLNKQPPNPILKEIMQFMKEKNMAKITRITPGILMAFNSYPDVYNFFQDVLDDEVSKKFELVTGKRPLAEQNHKWDIKDLRRYLLVNKITPHLTFMCGFNMPDSNEIFPSIKAILEIVADSAKWYELAKICKKVMEDSAHSQFKWTGFNLDLPTTWAGITLETSFEEFFIEKDHVLALKNQFLNYLGELDQILKTYPDFKII